MTSVTMGRTESATHVWISRLEQLLLTYKEPHKKFYSFVQDVVRVFPVSFYRRFDTSQGAAGHTFQRQRATPPEIRNDNLTPFKTTHFRLFQCKRVCRRQFNLFPQCFLPFWRTLFHFHQI